MKENRLPKSSLLPHPKISFYSLNGTKWWKNILFFTLINLHKFTCTDFKVKYHLVKKLISNIRFCDD